MVTGFSQEPRSTSKLLVLRQVWDQTGKSIPSLRSGPGAVVADPVKWVLGNSTVMMQVEGQSEGQSRSVESMARQSNCCSWAGNWHLQQRLKAEWPEMRILGPWTGSTDGWQGGAAKGQWDLVVYSQLWHSHWEQILKPVGRCSLDNTLTLSSGFELEV